MEVSSFPDDFRCPISLEVMSDPVILSSGHTFDRASIQRWLDSGNLTCPVTNLPLPRHPSLIPNHALRRLICQFAPPPSSPPPPPLSFPSDPQTLADLLRTIRTSSPDHRRTIADSQIPFVLFRHVSSRGEDHLQKLAIYCLLYLSLDDDDIKVGLVAEGGVDHLIEAVESATAEGSSKREKKEAATAIYELSKFPENRKRVVWTGAVGELARMGTLSLPSDEFHHFFQDVKSRKIAGDRNCNILLQTKSTLFTK